MNKKNRSKDAPVETKTDKAEIVREALALLNEEGIEKLSMRKLAARLNLSAPSIYWYFPDRSSILREVIRTLLIQSVQRVPECETWQEWLRHFGASCWETDRDVPYATLLLQSAELNDGSIVNLAIEILEVRRRQFGVDWKIFHRAHADIQAYVLGWAVFYHSRVTQVLEDSIPVDEAVLDGISSIVKNWEQRAQADDI